MSVWSNVYTSIIGGALVGLGTFIYNYIKNKRIELKYPIKGDYLTTFEDEDHGRRIEQTAIATLQQKGKKIFGSTNLGDRKWILDGEISTQGYFYGIYYAEDPIDNGIGNFFLELEFNRNMNGIWSGYDSKNGKVFTGRYIFKRMDNFKVKNAEVENICKVVDIIDNELGKNYVEYSQLEQYILNSDEYICKIAVNKFNAIVGFCLCRILERNNFYQYVKVDETIVPPYVNVVDKIGVIKTVVIDKKYQGLGVGSLLVNDAINEFKNRGTKVISSVAWKNGEKVNIGGILEKIGMKPCITIEDYWKEESLMQGFSCPVCGKPPCHCSAIIYFKSLQ